MPLASIDIGSNSVRMLIAEVSEGRIAPLRYERVTTRLAGGLRSTGSLDAGAMEKTLDALALFVRLMKEHGTTALKAVGTSALREANNSASFRARILSETGIEVEVVSGEREALLTAAGVLGGIEAPLRQGFSSSVIIDIGGGSTEWIYSSGEGTAVSGTLPVGVVKLCEHYKKSDPPAEAELRLLAHEAGRAAAVLKGRLSSLVGDETAFIATAGTASTIASLDLGLAVFDRVKVHMHRVTALRLREILELLVSLPSDKRAALRGLEPAREDLIIPGIALTIKIMEALGFNEMLVSAYGVLEGIMLKFAEEVGK